jgi:hypothetical protein
MITTICHRLRSWFLHETWAIPVDIFRILVGVLGFFYFASLLFQVKDFSSPAGLISHEFYLENFAWLKINLIQPFMVSDEVFYVLTGIACVGSLGLIVGYRVKLLAAMLFISSVSIQRWNFAVMFVDDGIMHLAFFWLMLLPVGKTLVLSQWLKEGNLSFRSWLNTKVPGFAVSCFIGNICWAYFFAGITKATSPMWQDGFALYPILLLPISRMPDFWRPEHIPLLKLFTYASIFTEITLPFFLLSPKGSLRKWFGLIMQITFHIGIIVTLKIPFANIALLASGVLFFRGELMDALSPISRRYPAVNSHVVKQSPVIKVTSTIALLFVILVCLSTTRKVPILWHVGIPATQALWLIGVSQDYRLFDWVQRVNYHVERKAKVYHSDSLTPQEIDPNKILTQSVRHALIEARIFDVYWLLHIRRDIAETLKKETTDRIARRACQKLDYDGRITLQTILHHVTPDNIALKKKPEIYEMDFYCRNGKVVN